MVKAWPRLIQIGLTVLNLAIDFQLGIYSLLAKVKLPPYALPLSVMIGLWQVGSHSCCSLN